MKLILITKKGREHSMRPHPTVIYRNHTTTVIPSPVIVRVVLARLHRRLRRRVPAVRHLLKQRILGKITFRAHDSAVY